MGRIDSARTVLLSNSQPASAPVEGCFGHVPAMVSQDAVDCLKLSVSCGLCVHVQRMQTRQKFRCATLARARCMQCCHCCVLPTHQLTLRVWLVML